MFLVNKNHQRRTFIVVVQTFRMLERTVLPRYPSSGIPSRRRRPMCVSMVFLIQNENTKQLATNLSTHYVCIFVFLEVHGNCNVVRHSCDVIWLHVIGT